MTKIVQLVNTCRECPNCRYHSSGTYACAKVIGANYIPDRFNSIPAWCPLADYPAGVKGMDTSASDQPTPAPLEAQK